MCENLFLFVYRGKKRSEKYTLIHQCFFRRTGTRVHNSIFFFFILLHALQNCLHLLQETYDIYNFKK